MTDTTFDFDLLEREGFPLRHLQEGEKVFVADDEAGCMYVVRSGKVKITSSGTILENIGPSGLFGEMALIDGAPRSATAIALEPTEVVEIDESAFLTLVQQNPNFALYVMRKLAERLRRMNESV